MKVLVAYDGSERGDAALRDLKRVGLGADVEARVLSVAEVWIPPPETVDGSNLWREALREVRSRSMAEVERAAALAGIAADGLRDEFPKWKVAADAVAGSAAWSIVRLAEQWSADLVVLGDTGRHGLLARLGIGSVALQVLTHLRYAAVRIARDSFEPRPLRILVGVDGSLDAQLALDAICARHWPAGSEIRVITAVDSRMLANMAGAISSDIGSAEDQANVIAAAAARKLRQTGFEVSQFVTTGDPRQVLLEQAQGFATDCIFLGARGLTRVERFILGSVSTTVAMHARCSVEVVHAKPAT